MADALDLLAAGGSTTKASPRKGGDALDRLAEETDQPSQEALPRAGIGHYLARGGLQGISALADMPFNAAKLVGAGTGFATREVSRFLGGHPQASDLPDVGEANPIGRFLLRGYHLDEPVRPSSGLGELGGAALEGAGAGIGQGPMGVLRQAPALMAKQIAAREATGGGIGALAGAGAYGGGEMTGGNPVGALAGGVLAGVVAPSSFLRLGGLTVGATRAAMKTAEDAKLADLARQAGQKIEPAFSDYVGSQLKASAAGTPNAADNLSEGIRLRQQIPGFNPSVAEMSNSPGLIDMQRKFALTNPQALNEEVARMQGNEAAIKDYYRKIVPEAKQPSSVRSALNETLAKEQQSIAASEQGVAAKVPEADQLQVGSQLADIAKTERTTAKVEVSKAYDAAFERAGDVNKVNIAPVKAAAEEILGEKLSEIKASAAPQTVRALAKLDTDKVTLEQLDSVRKAVNADLASAGASLNPIAATQLRNLGILHKSLDEAVSTSALPQEAKDLYGAALAKYRNEYAPRFKEGTPGQVFRDKTTGEERILPDKFVSEFFKPDASAGATRAMQFGKLFGPNQQAKELAKAGILDIYKRQVIDPTTGAIRQGAHDSFLTNHSRSLEAFKSQGVNALDEIKAVGQEARQVTAANDKLADVTKSLKFDSTDDLVDAALKSTKTMGNVAMRLTPETRQAFGSSLLDRSLESGTGVGMNKFLTDNAKTLRMVVPERQLSALQDISKAMTIAERAPIRGNLASGGVDALKNATGLSTATVFAQIRAVTGQRSSVEWAAINLAMPALNKMTQTNFASVMKQALHSPDSAEALRNYLLAQSPQQANNFATRFFETAKRGAGLAWGLRGPITKNFIGPQEYPGNFALSGQAIRSQIEQQQ